MRHVILEGPDGAGKTTLAQTLIRRHGFLYHHEGVPPAGYDSLLHHYARLLVDAKEPTVFDRFHLGEIVYGQLLRGKSRFSIGDAKLMNRLLRSMGATVIGCLPAFDTCIRNNRAKEELIKDERVLAAAYQQWQRVFFTGNGLLLPNGIIYDYEGPPVYLRPTEALEDGVVGHTRARFLFVGEKSSGPLDLPFFKSGYFNSAISEAGFSDVHCAFTNAQYQDGRARNLARIVLGFRYARVTLIALGKVAEQAIKDQNIQHMSMINCVKQVPHPAHGTARQDYVEMLKEIHGTA